MAILNMIFRYLDILSPRITLYFKENPIHPSLFSAILSIISSFNICVFAIYYIIQYINKENKTNFPVSASSIFILSNL